MDLKTNNVKAGESFEIIRNIIENYKKMEESVVDQLGLYYKQHGLTTGTFREDIWMQIFERIVPKKFVIEHSVFIIDSYCDVSKEVDLAIVDTTYTPYIFQYGRLKFVPIEAVAAVVECKSTQVTLSEGKNLTEQGVNHKGEAGRTSEGLNAWCESIENLRTSRESVVRIASGIVKNGISTNVKANPYTSYQTSTRPIRIFCGYNTKTKMETLKKMFDFILIAVNNEEEKRISVTTGELDNLKEWYVALNHYKFDSEQIQWGGDRIINKADAEELGDLYLKDLKVMSDDKEVSMLSFNFQLNQLLMLLNNPIMFPHRAYAKMFNGEKREKEC